MFKSFFKYFFIGIMMINLQLNTAVDNYKSTFSVVQHEIFDLIYSHIVGYYNLIVLDKKIQNKLQIENNQLKEKIQIYSTQLAIKSTDLQTSSQAAGINSKIPNGIKTLAKVNIDPTMLNNGFILIDKGKNFLIAEGDGVVSVDGVVGQVVKVNQYTSQVKLITSKDAKIFAKNESGFRFLVDGAGDNKLIINHLDKNISLLEGSIIYTTGLDHVYPGNFKIGVSSKIFIAENGFKYAICDPFFNSNNISLVAVLTHE